MFQFDSKYTMLLLYTYIFFTRFSIVLHKKSNECQKFTKFTKEDNLNILSPSQLK